MKYIVVFISEYGDIGTFGIFENQEDAINWMLKDANECISKASKNGIHYCIQESTDPCCISIQHHGKWQVNLINMVNE